MSHLDMTVTTLCRAGFVGLYVEQGGSFLLGQIAVIFLFLRTCMISGHFDVRGGSCLLRADWSNIPFF